MKTRRLGRTDLRVTEIGYGALEIGRPWGISVDGDFKVPGERDVQVLLDRVLELGINLIDTAPAYELSEERLGEMLRGRRQEFYLATKCGEHFDGHESRYDFSVAGTIHSIDASLRRLGTDYLDLVQIHCGPNEVETIRRGEALEGMRRAQEQGKVRWIGVSCQAAGGRAALEMNAYDVLQLDYSLLNRAVEETGDGESVLSLAGRRDVGIIVRESLDRGKLTDKVSRLMGEVDPVTDRLRAFLASRRSRHLPTSLSQAAIQFALRPPQVSTVLVGTRSLLHLEDAVQASGLRLDEEFVAELEINLELARPQT